MKHAFLFAVALLPLAACTGPSEAEVRAAIEAANHCEETSDCMVLYSRCPFDCYVPVHKDEAAALGALIESHDGNCEYGCVEPPTAACIQGRCVFER